MILVFDLLLGLALLWSGWRVLATSDPTRAIVLFIVFGLLMTLAWARLNAPDVALAEAAIGAGLTGALLLDALGANRNKAASRLRTQVGLLILALPLAAILCLAVLGLPAPAVDLSHEVAENLKQSGVTHPVTAVLLNFRGYDTLLEVAVLLLALLGVLALTGDRAGVARVARPGDPVLETLVRLAIPLLILAAGYLLWAGAQRPGGAFQAAAVLAAAAVLLHLARIVPAWRNPGRLLRLGLAGGLFVFLAVATVQLSWGNLLQYPPAWAGALILLVEAGLTLSLGLLLAGLFLFLTGRRAPP